MVIQNAPLLSKGIVYFGLIQRNIFFDILTRQSKLSIFSNRDCLFNLFSKNDHLSARGEVKEHYDKSRPR